MANYSFVQLPGNGITQNFGFSFPYMNKTHVGVKVDGVDTTFTWLTANIVQISPAPANGSIVEIRRTTTITEPTVDYSNGSVLAESDLDNSNLQTLYIAQELEDARANSILLASDGTYDAFNRRVSNVANPSLPQDSATKAYVDNQFAESGGGHALFSHTDTDSGAAVTPGAILLGDGGSPSKVSTISVGGKGALLVGVPSEGKKVKWLPIGGNYGHLVADDGKTEGLKWVPSHTFTSNELEMVGDGVTNNLALLNAGFTALPSGGGRICIGPGTYNFSAGVTVGDKPIIVEGCGKGTTILQMTSLASLQHFFNLTKSAIFRNLTIKVQTASGTDYAMYAIRLDLFAGGSSNQYLICDNVETLDFDGGLYADGGGINTDASLIDFVLYRNCNSTIMTANDIPREAGAAHRCKDVIVENCVFNNDNDGDHAFYAIRNKRFHMINTQMLNTPYHGLKLITEAGDIGELDQWKLEHCKAENNDVALMISTSNSLVLPQLTINDFSSKTSNPRDASVAAVTIAAADSSEIEKIELNNIRVKAATKAAVLFDLGATAKIRHVSCKSPTIIDWGSQASASWSAINKSGSGTMETFHGDDMYFDGNDTGKRPFNMIPNGVGALYGRTKVVNCTDVADSHAATFTE